jgi:hypothetical protein
MSEAVTKTYSLFNALTGFRRAALPDCQATVAAVTASTTAPPAAKTHQYIGVLLAKPDSQRLTITYISGTATIYATRQRKNC